MPALRRGALNLSKDNLMTKPPTRIQKRNRSAILTAGLEMFSQFGFRGTTLDQIADAAGLSKPNMLYYFPSKDSIYTALLEQLSVGGIMIIPVGEAGSQVVKRYKREAEDTYSIQDIMPVRFVPLLPDVAREGEKEKEKAQA